MGNYTSLQWRAHGIPCGDLVRWEVEGPEEPFGKGSFIEEDARVIAAAPDLLELLKDARKCVFECSNAGLLAQIDVTLERAGVTPEPLKRFVFEDDPVPEPTPAQELNPTQRQIEELQQKIRDADRTIFIEHERIKETVAYERARIHYAQARIRSLTQAAA